jgi:outer membrane protein assembly factor BamB
MSDDRLSEFRERREQAEAEEAERKRRVFDNTEEIPVGWDAPFGTVINQTDGFVVAQTLYKNRFALLDIQTGDQINEVELVRDESETITDEWDEWDDDEIPDNIELHPSGILELDTRPGWDPEAGVHWCIGPNAIFTFDDRGVSRYSSSTAGTAWTVEVPTDGAPEEPVCCAFLDGILVVATPDVLCAIQADTGELSWHYELSGGDSDDLRLLLHPETLYLSEEGDLIALDVDYGT